MLQPIVNGMIDIEIHVIANPKFGPPNRIPANATIIQTIPVPIQQLAKQHSLRHCSIFTQFDIERKLTALD